MLPSPPGSVTPYESLLRALGQSCFDPSVAGLQTDGWWRGETERRGGRRQREAPVFRPRGARGGAPAAGPGPRTGEGWRGRGTAARLSSCKRVWRRGGPVLCLLGTGRGRRAVPGRVLGTWWPAPSCTPRWVGLPLASRELRRLHVGGEVAVLRGKLKACLVAERCGSQSPWPLV